MSTSRRRTFGYAAFLAGLMAFGVGASAGELTIVAAENFYGDIARQIGGANVRVTSILSNPDQDPHLFEADPATARLLKGAGLTITNGVDYDPWMGKLLKADPAPGRVEIVVADLVGMTAGVNPHFWYAPGTISILAKTLADRLATLDPAHKAQYESNVAAFAVSMKPLTDKIAAMKTRHAGTAVTASEPVFGYMAEALGLDMRNKAFQLSVMNGTEPSPADAAALEDDLKGRKVKVMLYNSQADDQTVRRLVGIAKDNRIPVVGVTETEPAGVTYQGWMLQQLEALDRALMESHA